MSAKKKQYVLVLDDDPWQMSWIEDMAETHGLACEYVSTLDEATVAFDEFSPIIAVVDIRIGEVDAPPEGATLRGVDPDWVGLRFLRFIRVERHDSKAAVFVYTGVDREELQRVVEDTYSSRFFTKFEGDEFRRALESQMVRIARR